MSESQEGFLQITNKIFELRMQLATEITPTECFVLDVIIRETIGWNVEIREINLKTFVKYTHLDTSNLYKVLTKLQKRKLIIKQKHGNNAWWGLNPEYFGELIVKKCSADLALPSRVKSTLPSRVKSTLPVGLNLPYQTGKIYPTDSEKEPKQVSEIIDENPGEPAPLNTLLNTPLNTFLKKRGDFEEPNGSIEGRGMGKEKTQKDIEDRQKFLLAQAKMIKDEEAQKSCKEIL